MIGIGKDDVGRRIDGNYLDRIPAAAIVIVGLLVILFFGVYFIKNLKIDLWEVEDPEGPDQNEKLWEQSFEEDVSLTHYVFPYQFPRISSSINGEIIDPAFAYSETGTIYALNFTDGSIMWAEDFGAPFPHPPAVSGGSLYVFTDDTVFSYDPLNGTVNWKIQVTGLGHVEPSFDLDSVLFLTGDEVLYSFTIDGQIEWHYQIEGGVRNSLFANDRHLVWNDDQGRIHCYDLENATVSGDQGLHVDQRWVRKIPSNGIKFGEITTRSGGFLSSREYHELFVVWTNDEISLIHANTGEEHWSLSFPSTIDFPPSVFFSKGESLHPEIEYIYVLRDDHVLTSVLPNGSMVWNTTLDEPIILPPRLSATSSRRSYPNIFLASTASIRVIHGSTGATRTELQYRDGLRSVTLSDDQLIISSGRNVISYYNRYASPRDYAGSTPAPSPLFPMLIAIVAIGLRRRNHIAPTGRRS